MLQRDYIMRLVREFAEALELFLKGKPSPKQDKKLDDLYQSYVGDAVFYRSATMNEVMQSFDKWKPEERLDRMEMLAMLYYVDGDRRLGGERQELLQRALQMFTFIDSHSRVYSIERMNRMADIRRKLA